VEKNIKTLIIAAEEGSRFEDRTKDKPKSLVQPLGVSLIERVILTAKQAGADEFVIVVDCLGERIRAKLGNGEKSGVKITYVENPDWKKGNGICVLKAKELLKGEFILLMADHIFDSRIMRELMNHAMRSSVILAVDRKEASLGDTKVLENEGMIADIGKEIEKSNCIYTGILRCSSKVFSYIEKAVKEGKTELGDGIGKAALNRDAEVFYITQIKRYVPSMRKDIKPFWVNVDAKEDLVKAKKLLIKNAGKGRNDLLATYVNKPIENFVVSRLANTEITPNQITILTNIAAYTSAFLFLNGYLLVASLLTFVVSFMDGVDGKLSRVKMVSSNIGKMEHPFDFLFEHSWYIALALYLSETCGPLVILLGAFIILFDSFSLYCGRVFADAIKNRSLADYGPIEQLFRKFDGRKNSYILLILVGVLINAPFYSLAAVAIWAALSALFYCSRAMKHLGAIDKRKVSLGR